MPVTNRRVCNRKVDVLFSGYNEAEGRSGQLCCCWLTGTRLLHGSAPV